MKRTQLRRGESSLKRTPMKRQRTRHRDTTASRAIRKNYRLSNHECELSPLLKRLGQIVVTDDSGLECHHIAMGNAGRIDVASNLICVSPVVHRWIHAEPSHGTIACLYAKMMKNPSELDPDEFRLCTGQYLAGYVSSHKPEHEWMAPLWQELLSHVDENAMITPVECATTSSAAARRIEIVVTPSLLRRFRDKVKTGSDDSCWEWTGCRGSGNYGRINVGGTEVALSSRVSWVVHNGTIPDGLCVLHKCDNPPCVNPHHLFLGTMDDNTKDMFSKGRAARSVGECSGNSKMSTELVLEIRRKFATEHIRKSELARMFCVAGPTISQIVNRVTWRHVPAVDYPPKQPKPVKVKAPRQYPSGKDHHSYKHPENVARGERAGRSKLTADQVVAIRLASENGETTRVLASAYGVSSTAIRLIITRENWAHVA